MVIKGKEGKKLVKLRNNHKKLTIQRTVNDFLKNQSHYESDGYFLVQDQELPEALTSLFTSPQKESNSNQETENKEPEGETPKNNSKKVKKEIVKNDPVEKTDK